MRVLHGNLEYSPKKPALIQLFDPVQQREFDIWPYVDGTFLSFSGLPVVFIKNNTSFSLSLSDEDTDLVFQHDGSLESMWLKKNGIDEPVDIAKILKEFLTPLNGRQIVVEADNEHFKISVVQNEEAKKD